MATTWTTQGKYRHSHKFFVSLGITAIGFLLAALMKNTVVYWVTGVFAVITCWFFIMTMLAFLEKLSNN